MEVILSQDVDNLGKSGQVLKVKDGFARNFLIPQKKAYLATPANLKRIEQEKAQKAVVQEKMKKEFEELAQKLAKVSCTITDEVNDLDKLYGSVSEVDIARVLEAEGYKIDRKLITLEKPIEELGIYEVPIQLHPEVTAKVRLWVTKK